MTWDDEAVRAASRAALAEHGLTVPDHLPWLDRDPPRSREDVIGRTLALYGVMTIVEGGPFDVVHESLLARGLDRHLSETEHRYLGARRRGEEPSERDRIDLSWRGEGMVALGWALQLSDELPLDGVVPDDFARTFAPLDPFGEGSGPDPAVRLRAPDELLAALDRFYCASWAVRENELTGGFEPWPAELVPGAIWERRHALEWVVGDPGVGWDDVDLST